MSATAPNGTRVIKRQTRHVRQPPVGSSPGTLIADPNAHAPVLTLTMMSPKSWKTIEEASLDDVRKARGKWPVLWLDCAGLADVALIKDIGKMFDLHPLALEDTVNTGTRPKSDMFASNVFVVLTMIDDATTHRYEQISVFFGTDFVVTFQERSGDPFGPVRRRIDSPLPNRLRERKADYLAYALIDSVVDSYFPLVDSLVDKTDKADDELLASIHKDQAQPLHLMRRNASQLKRPLAPLRETVAALLRSDTPLIAPDTKIFLNDTLDHTTTLIELVESQRDVLTGLIEMHLSLSQAKSNDVISLLTIVSAIFIPLTFLAAIWGMNFDSQTSPWNMPELRAFYGYPLALGFMALIGLGTLAYFKWKKWL